MSTALHRRTKQLVPSANTPDFPVADWIINPDLSAVAGWDARYWIVNGDAVSLMDAAGRAAVDKAMTDASLDAAAAQLDEPTHPLRAITRVVINELTTSAQTTNAILSAIAAASSLADLKQRAAAIQARQTRTLAEIRAAMRNLLGS